MKKKIIGTVILLIIVAGGFITLKLFRPAISNKEGLYFYIKEGETLAGVKEELTYRQFLKGGGFDLACKFLRFKKPKPGRYLLKDGMNAWKLVRMLRSGDQALVKITIVKERTKELLSAKMGRGKKFDVQFDSLQMISYLNNSDSLKKFGVDTSSALSIIIPDTYLHKWNSTPDRLMQQLYAAYKKFWNPERKAKASKQNLSPQQVMILASIVEEETNRKDDKYNVASVYINRLREGMRLQADPTVKFITRNFQLGRITGTHLKLESPYNTYLHEGLPPGPICTPSIESIEAVLNAPQTDYLFFVSSYKFDGSSIFTSNLYDHNKYARLFHSEQNRRADSMRKLKEKPAVK
ncbi:MAG: endolytic transglycosylase MltG [Bacteroidota bacterium]